MAFIFFSIYIPNFHFDSLMSNLLTWKQSIEECILSISHSIWLWWRPIRPGSQDIYMVESQQANGSEHSINTLLLLLLITQWQVAASTILPIYLVIFSYIPTWIIIAWLVLMKSNPYLLLLLLLLHPTFILFYHLMASCVPFLFFFFFI